MGSAKRKAKADPKLIKLEAELAAAQDELDRYWTRLMETITRFKHKRERVSNLINRIRRHKLSLETPCAPSLPFPVIPDGQADVQQP